jgi:hypothetical protein
MYYLHDSNRCGRHARGRFAQALLLGCLLLLGPLISVGCVSAQQKADAELASRIDQALLTSDELNLSRVEVSVESGVVYLSGMSDDQAGKVHAEKEAAAIPGVKRVTNEIRGGFLEMLRDSRARPPQGRCGRDGRGERAGTRVKPAEGKSDAQRCSEHRPRVCPCLVHQA